VHREPDNTAVGCLKVTDDSRDLRFMTQLHIFFSLISGCISVDYARSFSGSTTLANSLLDIHADTCRPNL